MIRKAVSTCQLGSWITMSKLLINYFLLQSYMREKDTSVFFMAPYFLSDIEGSSLSRLILVIMTRFAAPV